MNSKLLLLPVLLLTLSACAMIPTPGTSPPTPRPASTSTQTHTSATKPILCSELQIVQLSRLDTDGTKEQVEANNHVLTARCGPPSS